MSSKRGFRSFVMWSPNGECKFTIRMFGMQVLSNAMIEEVRIQSAKSLEPEGHMDPADVEIAIAALGVSAYVVAVGYSVGSDEDEGFFTASEVFVLEEDESLRTSGVQAVLTAIDFFLEALRDDDGWEENDSSNRSLSPLSYLDISGIARTGNPPHYN